MSRDAFTNRLAERIKKRLFPHGEIVSYPFGRKEEERLADLLFELLEDELFHVKPATKES